MMYLWLDGAGPRAYLETLFRERLVRRDGQWIAPFRKRATVVTWRIEGPCGAAPTISETRPEDPVA